MKKLFLITVITSWAMFANAQWSLTGNSGTTWSQNFLGTTDTSSLNFRINSQESGWIDPISGLYLGYQAGYNDSPYKALRNTGIGYYALKGNTYGSHNTAIGYQALSSQSYANGNTAWATDNTAIGYQALFSNQPTGNGNGYRNTAVGYQSLYNNTTGQTNTALGWQALFTNSTANGNTGIGYATLNLCNGNWNTALGAYALQWDAGGVNNTGSGAYALDYNATGSNNTAEGYYALAGNNAGSNNTAIGAHALYENFTFPGAYASNNTAIGANALYMQGYTNGNTTWATDNVAIGYNALYSNNPTSNNNGYQNTALGDYAGYNVTNPSNANVTGSGNTFIGYNAAPGTTTQLSNSTAIGANSTVLTSNTMVMGNNSVTQFQFNGALMPNDSGNYNAGTIGQVLTSQGSGVPPVWASPGSGALWQQNGSSLYYSGGNIGIGISHPNYPLQIMGNVVDSGSLFATNIAVQNTISVGNFRLVNGVVVGASDTIASAGNIMMAADTLVAANNIQAQSLTINQNMTADTVNGQTLNAGQTLKAGTTNPITIDGNAGTITSPTGSINFASDTIKAGDMNISGNSVTMPGIVTDTVTDLMGINRHGVLTPLGNTTMADILYPPIPPLFQPGTCDTAKALWYSQLGLYHEALVTKSCTWVGIGEAGFSGYPDAPLSISSSKSNVQFAVANPTISPPPDVFTIDYGGNTNIHGNTSIAGIAGIGTAPSTLTTLNVLGVPNQYTTIYSQADNANTYNIMAGIPYQGNQNNIIGLAVHILNPNNPYDVFDVYGNGNTYVAGNLVIGSGLNTPGNYGLYVGNGILTSLVKIATVNGAEWSDYVLGNDYKLKPLSEVAQYIKENKHLPDVPSATDVQKNGINVAVMDATLLKKIEELTLYIIQQDKKIDELKKKVDALSNEHK